MAKKTSRAATVERRLTQVVNIIAAAVGRDKVRVDQIEQAIRGYDARRQRHADPEPWWPPGPRNKSDRRIGKSLGLALGRAENQFSRLVGGEGDGVLARAVYGQETARIL